MLKVLYYEPGQFSPPERQQFFDEDLLYINSLSLHENIFYFALSASEDFSQTLSEFQKQGNPLELYQLGQRASALYPGVSCWMRMGS